MKIAKKVQIPYLFGFFCELMFFYSFYNTYFLQNGFKGTHLASLLVAMQASRLLFIMPAGILSDLISRRNILILGLLLKMSFCAICLVSSNYYFLLLGCCIYGISMGCMQIETYFYDNFRRHNEEQKYPVFIGHFYAIMNAAIALASLGAGKIYTLFGFNGVFGGSIIALSIAILLLLMMPNYKQVKDKVQVLEVKESTKIIALIKSIIKKPKIMQYLIMVFLFEGLFFVFIDLNTILMNEIGFKPQEITHVLAVLGVVKIFFNGIAGYTVNFLTFKRLQSYLFIFMFVSLILSFINGYFLVAIASSYYILYAFFDLSARTRLQNHIDSATRATIMSIEGILASVFVIVMNASIGVIANIYGYLSSITFVSLITIIMLFVSRNIMLFYRLDNNIRGLFSRR